MVGDASIPFPTPQRQHEIQARFVGQLPCAVGGIDAEHFAVGVDESDLVHNNQGVDAPEFALRLGLEGTACYGKPP